MHLCTFFFSLSEALDKSDGLMVLAVLFEKDPYDGHGQWMEGIRPYKKLCNVRRMHMY